MDYFDILDKACEEVNISFDEEKYKKFKTYMDLIKEWNKKVNLTAITDDEGIIKKHFIDCIKIFKFSFFKDSSKVIDIGTGAGFPGIPMKIIVPSINITLLDSLNKRITFLNEVISSLKLDNIFTVHGRAEDFGKEDLFREKFDVAVSRAVANLTVLSELSLPFVKPGGYFCAMKGPSAYEEVSEAKNAISTLGGRVEDIISVDIEESDLKHNLVIVKKIKNTSKIYPRKPNIISKRPLK